MRFEITNNIGLVTSIMIVLIVISFVAFFTFMFFNKISPLTRFESACESFDGHYWEVGNITCGLGHDYCFVNCKLNDKEYNLDEVGAQFSYGKYFCVEDCAYENAKAGEVICVC